MTLKGCFCSFSSTAATMRAVASVPPPATHGQMMVTGRLGQVWARAGPRPSVATAPAVPPPLKKSRRVELRMIVSSMSDFAARIPQLGPSTHRLRPPLRRTGGQPFPFDVLSFGVDTGAGRQRLDLSGQDHGRQP